MRAGQRVPMNETEQAFWLKAKSLVISDTSALVLMAVAVFVGLVVTMF
jgi:hypothetical protein